MAGCTHSPCCCILERGTEGRDLTINFTSVPIAIGYHSYLTLLPAGSHVPAPGCNREYRERPYERRYDSGGRGVDTTLGTGWVTKVPAPASPASQHIDCSPKFWVVLVLVGEVANTAGSSVESHTPKHHPPEQEPLPPFPSPAFPTSQDLVKHR